MMGPMKYLPLVLCLLACLLAVSATAEDPEPVPFPNLALKSLDQSSVVHLESLRGNPVLLTFWASWCGPCRVELPELVQLSEDLKGKGLTLITVNLDQTRTAASVFLQRNNLDLPVYRLSRYDLMSLGIQAVPTNILLDDEGHAIQVYEGYAETVVEDIRRIVEELAEKKQPSGGA